MEDELCGTMLTGKMLQDLLAASPQLQLNGHRLRKVEAEVVGVNCGFTSKVLRVSLDWDEPSPNLPTSVIVKVIGGDSSIQDIFTKHVSEEQLKKIEESFLKGHNVECKVYYLDGLRKTVPMARCFGCIPSVDKGPGIIVLEDLSASGEVVPMDTWKEGFSEVQIDQCLDALSSLHAWSVNDTKWRQVIPTLVEENVLAAYYDATLAGFPQSKATFPEEFKRLDEEKFKETVNNQRYTEVFGADPKSRYNLPLVLVHGDIHGMNMLFEKKDNGPGKLLALIDWQLAHQGCGMEDIARIMVLNVSTEMRRKEGDRILSKYVQLFNSKVNAVENRVTLEDCKRALDEMFSYLAIIWTNVMALMSCWDETLKDMTREETRAMLNQMMGYFFASLDDACTFFGW